MACSDLISTEDMENAKVDAASLSEEVESGSDTLVTRLGETKKTMTGRNNAAQSALDDFESEGDDLLDDLQTQADNIIYTVGFKPAANPVFEVGAAVQNSQETLTYNGEQYNTQNGPFPVTVDAATPELDSEDWFNVTIEARKTVARSLNVLDSQVIYATDTSTVLDDVLYIYDSSTQKSWIKPSGIPDSSQIVSVTGNQLTYTGSVVVSMSKAVPQYHFFNVEDMQDGKPIWGDSGDVSFTIPQRMTTGGITWETGVSGLVDLGGGIFASPIEYVNVRDFNPTMDGGTTDDTPAFQSASDTGKAVYIPQGSYYILDWDISSTCYVFGDGANASFLRPFATGDMIAVSGSGDYVTFFNLRFIHDRSFAVNAIHYQASFNNRWNHIDNCYFEGLDGAALKATTIMVECSFTRLKISKCANSTTAAIDFETTSTGSDHINNIHIDKMNMYSPQGIGVHIKSAADVGSLPGSRTVRITDSLIHGGNATGGTTPAYPAPLVKIDGASDFMTYGTSYRQVATDNYAIVLTSALTLKNRGGLIENCIFASDEGSWKGIFIDNTQDMTVGTNRFASGGCVENIHLGSDALRIYLERQNTYIGGDVIIDDNGSTTRGYTDDRKLVLSYNGSVALSGVRGLNGSINIAGSETITSGTTADVVFPNAEPDSSYRVIFSPSANVNVWRTNKTDTGFTINIDSAVSVVVDWFIVR